MGSDLETRNYTYGVDDSDKKADFSDNTIHPIASHEKIISRREFDDPVHLTFHCQLDK